MRRVLPVAICVIAAASCASTAAARVLRVGTYKGVKGQFRSIQAAVDAAKPGDWILVGPGDYKEHSGRAPKGNKDVPAGVLMTTPHVYLRGMERNKVIVDGTKPGSPVCSRKASDQEFGPHRRGLNGVLVWKANNVWVQNLTACNYLHGSGDTGNEIWWNGGQKGIHGNIGGHGFIGSYLNTTSTFFGSEQTAAQYGIFSSNWNGGTWVHTYASNFNDSGYYIGACQQVCNQVVDDAHGQFNALGYSGSNSGGSLIVKNSEFDQNEDGFDTNSQNGDNPAPQNGACPGNKISPITHTHSCWVFMNNFVHDNNNPNVPSAGAAAAGPVGTGMSVSGGRNDTIMNNTFMNNNAWGIILVPYSDSGKPCIGGSFNSPFLGKGGCLFDEWGDAIIGNKFKNNGSYGHPTNGDFSQLNFERHPSDCYRGNFNTAGTLAGQAAKLQQTTPNCSTAAVAPNIDISFLNEVLCDSQVKLSGFGCQAGESYPRRTRVVMHPLPKTGLKTMPNPCDGVPRNPWCPSGTKRGKAW
jgi:parallel beta-helix repeat protein